MSNTLPPDRGMTPLDLISVEYTSPKEVDRAVTRTGVHKRRESLEKRLGDTMAALQGELACAKSMIKDHEDDLVALKQYQQWIEERIAGMQDGGDNG